MALAAGLAVAWSSTAPSRENAVTVTEALSPATRALIIREMQAVAEAMGRIHKALVTGDHATVTNNARAIHDSFVLNQELTPDQRSEISNRLPADFVAADRSFHALAGNLVQAGEGGDPTLERLWFEEMTRACQACHARFASGRFPGLVSERVDQSGHR